MPHNVRSNSGRALKREWDIPAQHVLYHHQGRWFHLLEHFPGALCDREGYVLFEHERDFVSCPNLRIRAHTKAANGISHIAGYIRKVS
jgi:hypothetical protein